MIGAAILAASMTFTATATGVEKGTPVEFVFAGANTDRDYETMFLIDGSVDDFCRKLEACGLPRGEPTDESRCRLWPVGCTLAFSPALETYVEGKMPEGLVDSSPVYTGGTRLSSGACDAGTNMPAAVFSIYSLAQSPIVYNGVYNQGSVYGSFMARQKLKKGERVSFSVSWDERTLPRKVHLTVRPGNSVEILNRLRTEAEKGEVNALIGFEDGLTVAEATAAANALATIDSQRVKINGSSNVFYRAFLPLVKWQDRKERLTQPFELTLGDRDRLVFIDEDWSVEGPEPKLTEIEIPAADVARHPKTDTCFIFAERQMTVSRIVSAMNSLKGGNIRNWYVFQR